MKNKPLKILYDASPLVNGAKSGVGYYSYNLLDALAQHHPDDIEIVAHYFDFLGRRRGVSLPKHPNIRYVRSRILPGKALNIMRRVGLQLPLELLFKTQGDVAVFPNFVSLPSLTGIPTVVAIHDLCYEDVPQYVSEKNRNFLQRFVPKSVRSAAGIITISESSKRAIQKHYGQQPNIIVAGIPPVPPTNTDEREINGLQKDFILFVSTLEPRKNVISLVKGYELLPDKLKKKHALVLAGGTGWDMEADLEYIRQSQASGSNIVMAGYVSDQEKEWLYNHAALFAMPSHYEGFGMPILEAMIRGIPTAVSDIDVFHEVADDASIYFDKDNPADIARTMEQILTNNKLRQDLIKKGTKRVNTYSWEETAAQIYKELVSIANEKRGKK